ncbi:MAG TPA: DNA polymerase IV, partial [Candidatus Hydrogenedentes bacterium]|nr:DNA polymerase IV [Candidatus Hydrogenedentota bacterium]
GQSGHALQRAAQGVSTSPVEPFSATKSVGRETTFEQDLLDWKQIGRILFSLAERALYALREKQMETRCVTLKVRYSDFSTCTFAKTLPDPTCIDADIHDALRGLIPKAQKNQAPVRLIGITLSSLTHKQHQLPLFGGERSQRWERVLESADHIRDRYGLESLRFARSMD